MVVGARAAGSAAAEMLRRSGYAGRITLIDEDDGSLRGNKTLAVATIFRDQDSLNAEMQMERS